MHRLFVALRPSKELQEACLSAMVDGPSRWAWQTAEQLHITLRYIGEVDRLMAEEIAQSLGQFHAPAPIIRLGGVGHFDHGPRSALFARATPKEPLDAIHRKLDHLLVRLGLEPERRAFLPHITLARHRRGADDPQGWLERQAGLSSPASQVGHVTLYESHLGKHGATYEAIARYPLDMAARNPI